MLLFTLQFIYCTQKPITAEPFPVRPMCIWRFDSESAVELNPEIPSSG